MQSKIKIPFPEDLRNSNKAELVRTLQQEIQLHKDQIGYMIQDYYPKQKVRVAEMTFPVTDSLELFVKFSLEEFSSCAAIDTYELSAMKILVITNEDGGEIDIVGEEWAE